MNASKLLKFYTFRSANESPTFPPISYPPPDLPPLFDTILVSIKKLIPVLGDKVANSEYEDRKEDAYGTLAMPVRIEGVDMDVKLFATLIKRQDQRFSHRFHLSVRTDKKQKIEVEILWSDLDCLRDMDSATFEKSPKYKAFRQFIAEVESLSDN